MAADPCAAFLRYNVTKLYDEKKESSP